VFHESAKTGYKNLDEKYVQKKEIQSSIQQKDAAKEGNQWKLQPKERLQRIKDTISVLPFIYSTTKGALHLTDVTPKFIILAVIEGGNHLFMNITNESTDQPVINVAALQEVLTDYKDSILSDIYIGHQEGFIDTVAKALSELRIDNKTIHLQSPKKTVEEFVKNLDQYIE
jgi:CRISPR-associated protein Cst2